MMEELKNQLLRVYEKKMLAEQLKVLNLKIQGNRARLIHGAEILKASISHSKNRMDSAFALQEEYAKADQNFSEAVKEYEAINGQDLDDFKISEGFQADLKRVQGQLEALRRFETVSTEQIDNSLKEVLELCPEEEPSAHLDHANNAGGEM